MEQTTLQKICRSQKTVKVMRSLFLTAVLMFIGMFWQAEPVKAAALPRILASDLTLSNTVSGVKISWKAVEGAEGYRIYRKKADGTMKRIHTAAAGETSWTDKYAPSGMTVSYHVRAYRGEETGGYTSLSWMYLDPLQREDLTLQNRTDGIRIKWKTVDGALGYRIYRRTASGSYQRIASVTSGTTISYVDTSVVSDNGTGYVYAVRAVNGSYLGSYVGRGFYRMTCGKVSVEQRSASSVTANWKSNSYADGYLIRYADNTSFTGYKIAYASKGDVSKVISSLAKKTWYFKICSYRKMGTEKHYSAYSAVTSFAMQEWKNSKLIVIDAGHQRHANTALEPLGPGSSTKKKKVSGGTQGVATRYYEYQLNLDVSLQLQKELEERGYEVYMIRTTHEVDISNAERAKKANALGADVFIRIHANSGSSSSVTGAETLCMTAKNPWNASLYQKSRALSDCVLDEFCAATGAKKKKVWETDTMTGINWSQVPVTIMEMGYMSNASEDRLMCSAAYQTKMVQGMANGIDAYFELYP